MLFDLANIKPKKYWTKKISATVFIFSEVKLNKKDETKKPNGPGWAFCVSNYAELILEVRFIDPNSKELVQHFAYLNKSNFNWVPNLYGHTKLSRRISNFHGENDISVWLKTTLEGSLALGVFINKDFVEGEEDLQDYTILPFLENTTGKYGDLELEIRWWKTSTPNAKLGEEIPNQAGDDNSE